MPRPEEITESIRQLAQISGVVYEYLKPEHMTVRAIVADTHNLIREKDKIMAEIKQIEELKKQRADEHNNIIALAKEEADKILKLAREKLFEANEKNKQAEQFIKAAESAKYLAEKNMNKMLDKVAVKA